MTYNVFGGTLNLAQSISLLRCHSQQADVSRRARTSVTRHLWNYFRISKFSTYKVLTASKPRVATSTRVLNYSSSYFNSSTRNFPFPINISTLPLVL